MHAEFARVAAGAPGATALIQGDRRLTYGELELLPGLRLVPAPGHTPGSQVVVIGADGPVVIAGDTAVWFGELDKPRTEGQRLVRALGPELVWLAHTHKPWRPGAVRANQGAAAP